MSSPTPQPDLQISSVLRCAEGLDGLLTAVVCAPDIPLLGTWFSWALTAPPDHLSDSQMSQLCDFLMALLRDKLLQCQHRQLAMPKQCASPTSPTGNPQTFAWCEGFLVAQHCLQDNWQKGLDAEQSQRKNDIEMRLAVILKGIRVLRKLSRSGSQAKRQALALSDRQINALYGAIPQYLSELSELGGQLALALPDSLQWDGR